MLHPILGQTCPWLNEEWVNSDEIRGNSHYVCLGDRSSWSQSFRVTTRLQSLSAYVRKRNLLDGKVFDGLKCVILREDTHDIEHRSTNELSKQFSFLSWLPFPWSPLSPSGKAVVPDGQGFSPSVLGGHTHQVYEDLVHQQDHDTQAWLLATIQVLLVCILVTKDLNCAEWSASKTKNVQNERVKIKPTKCGEWSTQTPGKGQALSFYVHSSLRNEAQDSKRTYQTAQDLLCVTLRRQELWQKRENAFISFWWEVAMQKHVCNMK